MERITVRVPATTANLAAGFDTLGCALTLYNTLSFEKSEALSFTGCDEAYRNTDNLAYQGFTCVFDHIGQPVPAVHIDIRADIPVSRGLGSSAALLAAGATAANQMSGAGLSADTLIALTTEWWSNPLRFPTRKIRSVSASRMKTTMEI